MQLALTELDPGYFANVLLQSAHAPTHQHLALVDESGELSRLLEKPDDTPRCDVANFPLWRKDPEARRGNPALHRAHVTNESSHLHFRWDMASTDSSIY